MWKNLLTRIMNERVGGSRMRPMVISNSGTSQIWCGSVAEDIAWMAQTLNGLCVCMCYG